MKSFIPLAPLLACVTVAIAADDPVAQLRSARSLHCIYTSNFVTTIKNGYRTVEQNNDKEEATFDDIDLARGTARVIALSPVASSDDVQASWGSSGAFELIERAPGIVNATTIFPMYAEGTHSFVVLESRQSMIFQTVLGEAAYGTCRILQSWSR